MWNLRRRSLKVHAIVHGDDVDGLTCGAFLKRIFDFEPYLANYDNLENALEKVQPPLDTLFICDLNLREALEPLLLRIINFAEVRIIDHHQMEEPFRTRLLENGFIIRLETDDCASILTYDTYKENLGVEGARLAAYAAISDMFENGPIASNILSKMDRKFAQHEAQILTHALSVDQTMDFKRLVIKELSEYNYPHRIPGAVEAAVRCLEEMTQIKEMIAAHTIVHGRIAYMEAVGEQSTGAVANLIMDTLGVDVGLSYKPNSEYVNVSLRGEKALSEHLGDIAKHLGEKYNGFGGGHQRASGVKIPKENLELFLRDIENIFS
jgi:oligoribonuclease NrnB/cAMP/cGMP phosphodiesterase (DHH superfamily)